MPPVGFEPTISAGKLRTETDKHKGMHEKKIDNHEINKDMNSTKFFIIYISSKKPDVKRKIIKKKAHKGCVQ
jgi:hypothetical protein